MILFLTQQFQWSEKLNNLLGKWHQIWFLHACTTCESSVQDNNSIGLSRWTIFFLLFSKKKKKKNKRRVQKIEFREVAICFSFKRCKKINELWLWLVLVVVHGFMHATSLEHCNSTLFGITKIIWISIHAHKEILDVYW